MFWSNGKTANRLWKSICKLHIYYKTSVQNFKSKQTLVIVIIVSKQNLVWRQKNSRDTSLKINEWQINTWKILEKLKLRPQWDTTTHPPEWLKWVRLAIPRVREEAEQLEIIVEM